jgi:plastocyanin
MRSRLILLPLTLALVLVPAVPARAADFAVDVTDFAFTPPTQQVAVGDRVFWTFTDGGHTTTSAPRQAERWDSGPDVESAGASFEHTFTRPGRFQYVCTPHASFMKGTIVVGEDEVERTLSNFRSRTSGSTVTVSFRLNEAASMTYAVRGPRRKRIERRRLAAGRHSFKVRRLKVGSYRATLTLVDDFDNRARQTSRFAIR